MNHHDLQQTHEHTQDGLQGLPGSITKFNHFNNNNSNNTNNNNNNKRSNQKQGEKDKESTFFAEGHASGKQAK